MRIYKPQGFTIIEVLVVILLIGAFALALSPFARMARERAHKVSCANNLRLIGIALHRYALDHNAEFPKCSKLEEFANALTASGTVYVEDPAAFICPDTKTGKGVLGKLKAENIDYMYVSGLRADSPPQAPICADKASGNVISKKDNHGASGVNVLYVSGEVKWMPAVPAGKWVKE